MRFLPNLLTLALLAGLLPAGVPLPARAAVADADIEKILADRVDVAKKNIGIVVGVIDDKGARVLSRGFTAADKGKPVDGDTLFEIGSITKVFTSLLLADMIERGEVALDDPISRYLPAGTKAPRAGGKEITLPQLATNRSVSPRMPSNFSPPHPYNPSDDYT